MTEEPGGLESMGSQILRHDLQQQQQRYPINATFPFAIQIIALGISESHSAVFWGK